MRHILHSQKKHKQYRIAFLIPEDAFLEQQIEKYYVQVAEMIGISREEIISFSLPINNNDRVPAQFAKAALSNFFKMAGWIKPEILVVAHSDYFKYLTGTRTATPHKGYIMECTIPGGEGTKAVLTENYQNLFYDPTKKQHIIQSLTAVHDWINGTYQSPGTGILETELYPQTPQAIEQQLNWLANTHNYFSLDIETRGLRYTDAGIETIAFAWSIKDGFAFTIDRDRSLEEAKQIKCILYDFLVSLSIDTTIVYHGATFDIKILIYELFMLKQPRNMQGMLSGLNELCERFDDTMLLTYLATNSTAGNTLDLKSNSQEYCGNYALDDIKDTTKIPTDKLLQYNLIDAVATLYVRNKYIDTVIKDDQMRVYAKLLLPSVKVMVQTELCGMPMERTALDEANKIISTDLKKHEDALQNNITITTFVHQMKLKKIEEDNAKLKKKKRTIDDPIIKRITFNPNSNTQVADLLHGYLGLNVIDQTPTGQPKVGAETLLKHKRRLMNQFDITDEDLNGQEESNQGLQNPE